MGPFSSTGFPRVPDVVVSASPFVAKVEAWLRMMGLPYTIKYGSNSGTPKGQARLSHRHSSGRGAAHSAALSAAC